MASPNFQAPLLPTPRVVSQGTLRVPKATPGPRLQAPLLPPARVAPAFKYARRVS